MGARKQKAKQPIAAFAVPHRDGGYAVSYFPPQQIERGVTRGLLESMCRSGIVVYVRTDEHATLSERWEWSGGGIVRTSTAWEGWTRKPELQ